MRQKTLKRTMSTQLQLVVSMLCVGALLVSGACIVEKDAVDGNQTEHIDPGWTGAGGMGGAGGMAGASPSPATSSTTAGVGGAGGATTPDNRPIIYLNRCKGGCTVYGGFPSDSKNNVSSIIKGTVHLSEFVGSDATWNQIVDCVAGLFSLYHVKVSDEEPGNDYLGAYGEVMIAGTATEAGFSENTPGVSPFGCGRINNAISFVFGNAFPPNAKTGICYEAARQVGHTKGLDTVTHCPDVMSIRTDCVSKAFTAGNWTCGETTPRPCYCGTATQNSHTTLQHTWGLAQP